MAAPAPVLAVVGAAGVAKPPRRTVAASQKCIRPCADLYAKPSIPLMDAAVKSQPFPVGLSLRVGAANAVVPAIRLMIGVPESSTAHSSASVSSVLGT